LTYYLQSESVKPVERGFTIVREYFDKNGQKVNIFRIKEGTELTTKLTIVTPEIRRKVIIEDKLPAGLESVNNSLKNSDMLNADFKNNSQIDYFNYYFMHREYRDSKTALFADYLPAGVYEITYQVRATTPGIYHLPPAEVYEMYAPDVLGHTNGSLMIVDANK
jgi:hypothetical protein